MENLIKTAFVQLTLYNTYSFAFAMLYNGITICFVIVGIYRTEMRQAKANQIKISISFVKVKFGQRKITTISQGVILSCQQQLS